MFLGEKSGLSSVKSATALALLLGFAAALSAEMPWGGRILSDPANLPLGGQCTGSTAGTLSQMNEDVNNYLGALNSSRTVNSSNLIQSLAYGWSDDLATRLEGNYSWQSTVTAPLFGADTTANSQGFEDPILSVTWRFRDQRQGTFSWDLIGAYAPDLIQSQASSVTQTGSVARGGQTATLGLAMSRVGPDFTTYVEGEVTYLGRRSTLNTDQSTTDFDASMQYTLGVNTQTRFSDMASLNLGVTGYIVDNSNATNQSTQVAYVYVPGDEVVLNAALNCHFIPNRLVGSLTYGLDVYSTRASNYNVQTKSDTTTTGMLANVIGVRLDYAINE